jgi:hypothetical protein
MDINDFLNMLTPEQLEQLAAMKRANTTEEPPTKSKRKQKRKKETVQEEPTQEEPTQELGKIVRPKRKKGSRKTAGNPNLPKNKAYSRTEPVVLGKRPNLFIEEDTTNLIHQENLKANDILYEGIRPRPKSKKKVVKYVEARCTNCQDIFEDVSPSLCYMDDGENVFICDDCMRGKI